MIIIIVTTTFTDPGDRDRLADLFAVVRAESVKAPGVALYNIVADHDDPHVVYSIEVYTSEEVLRAHVVAPHHLELNAELATMDIKVDVRAWTGPTEPFDVGAIAGLEEMSKSPAYLKLIGRPIGSERHD